MAEHYEAKIDWISQHKPSGTSIILDGRYLPPPEDGDGKRWVRTSVIIQGSPQSLYARWRDVESATQWHGQTVEVRRTGERTSHWTMRIGDKTKEWDSEILADEPGKRIAWRSIGGDLDEAGEVVFEMAVGNRGTMVTLLQEFRMGALESAWETLTGRNPKQAALESLRNFKALAETGEIARTDGQPHGPRGTVAKMKQAAYSETVPKPPEKLRRAS
ncbi:MAG TPA: SRPBCC family protein [Terracidiphilus sp.]|nr:SRPBCC family protein [Terracidiphilus sp.]